MAKRPLRERDSKEEEDDDDDEDREVEEEEIEGEGEEDKVVERKKRVRSVGNCRERRAGLRAAKAVASCQQQQQKVNCQADGCEADLAEAKRYHQRHKVCEMHAKAAVVVVGGGDQRYCQQCSRFHELLQFDDNKRSCRERLAHHNERRRKLPPDQQKDDAGQIPVVLKMKHNSPGQTPAVKHDSWPTPKGPSETIKVTLPRNPDFKHFQIK